MIAATFLPLLAIIVSAAPGIPGGISGYYPGGLPGIKAPNPVTEKVTSAETCGISLKNAHGNSHDWLRISGCQGSGSIFAMSFDNGPTTCRVSGDISRTGCDFSRKIVHNQAHNGDAYSDPETGVHFEGCAFDASVEVSLDFDTEC